MAIKKTDDQNYQNIANAIRSINGEETTYTPAEMAGAIADISHIYTKFVDYTSDGTKTVDDCTEYDTIYRIRISSSLVTNDFMNVICARGAANALVQIAFAPSGFIIIRNQPVGENWSTWDFIPNSTRVASMVSAAIASKADKTEIPDISGKADKSTTLAGYGITDAYTKSEVDALVSNGVIPQYVIDESESVLAKAFAHKGLGRTIRFIAVSDSHNDATKVSHDYTRVSNMHCGQAVKYIADRIPLDFVAFLGDMTWAGVAHTTAQYQTDWLIADIQEMNMFIKDGFNSVPNIRVVGNHDQCATTDSGGTVSRLQNSGAYQYFGRYNVGINDGLSGYGYYDLENVKLRIIYLNTSDTVSTSTQGTLLNVSQEQKNWLCETLIDVNSKSDAANWKIMLMSHAPLDMVSGIAADILIPYTNGGTYGNYTFTNHSAKIIGNCHGHTHCYNVGYISDKIRRFTIPNSNFYDNNHYKNNADYSAWNEDTTYPKTENSRTDTSFSLVTVDLDNLTCYIDNYGAGYDREFSVDYNNVSPSYTNQIPISVDENGNIYNTTGYKEGYRINSSGAETAAADFAVTGFIPFTLGDTIRFRQFNGAESSNGGYIFYRSDHTVIGSARYSTASQYTSGAMVAMSDCVWTPSASEYNGNTGNQMDLTNVAYVRMVARFANNGTVNNPTANWIVTINEDLPST